MEENFQHTRFHGWTAAAPSLGAGLRAVSIQVSRNGSPNFFLPVSPAKSVTNSKLTFDLSTCFLQGQDASVTPGPFLVRTLDTVSGLQSGREADSDQKQPLNHRFWS